MSDARRIAVVTGGAGFIGSHMVDLLLDRDCEVRVIDNFRTGKEANLVQHARNPRLTVAASDIRDYQPGHSLFTNVDCVLHFAGVGEIVPSIERPLEYMSTNVQGTTHLLECARHAGVRKFVYAASSSCYGLARTPTREDHPIAPQYPYALSKYQGEQAAFHWHQVYGLPVNSIRLFNAYGPRSLTSGAYGAVFGVFLRQKLAGAPLTVVGDGSQSRDFLYVTDVTEAFWLAMVTDKSGETWNLGAGQPQSINRLVELLGGGPVAHLPKRPGEPERTWADVHKIQADLGWQPTVSFEDGVARLMATIEDWRDAPLWNPHSIAAATASWFKALSPNRANIPAERPGDEPAGRHGKSR
jgi:UDP-glucose 4-epimerase